MTRLIAVTGATGALGGRVAERLAPGLDDAGAGLRLVVRSAGRAPSIPGAEVTEFAGYADPASFTAALDGVHTLYLVSAAEAEDRLQQHLAAVQAAADAGVQRIVYTSFLDASPDAVFTLVRQHFATERTIAATGGDGRTSFVSRDDLADVGAAVLLDDSDRFDGQALDVTGPAALPLGEAAELLAEITGRAAEYRDQTVEEAWETRRPSGRPDWEIEGWVTSYLAIRAGELATVSDVVREVTGHPALTVAEHLRRHPGDWAHLA